MTLTDATRTTTPALSSSLPRDRWPEFTVSSATDVGVAGVSLLRLVDWCGTPCVHTAAAVIPGTDGRPSETELASVVVSRVLATEPRIGGGLDVWLDADLGGCLAYVPDGRMIGRRSTGATVVATPQWTGSRFEASDSLLLPADVRVGDLIAIPCAGATTLHDVRPRRHDPV